MLDRGGRKRERERERERGGGGGEGREGRMESVVWYSRNILMGRTEMPQNVNVD